MIALKRVLIPVDFGENSAQVLHYGLDLAKKFDAEVHLLHIIEDRAAIAAGPDGFYRLPGETVVEMVEETQKKLEEVEFPEGFQEMGRTCHVSEGAPFVEIIQYAKKHDIDLIVMGTHGKTGIVHMLMGSVAERVVRKAPCPVLTIRPSDLKFEMP